MNKKIAMGLALALGLALFAGCTAEQPAVSTPVYAEGNNTAVAVPTITVSGTGELELAPDMATIRFEVEKLEQATAEAALQAVSEAMAEVEKAMNDMGVKAEDMQTANFQLYETYKYDNNGNRKGDPLYNASNTLSVKIYDIDNVGAYIDAAIGAGATSSSGISFSFADPTQRENEALVLALENAKSRAEALATAAGKRVGEVLLLNDGSEVSEQVIYEDVPAAAMEAYSGGAGTEMRAMADYGTSVQPGTRKLTARVTVRFTLV